MTSLGFLAFGLLSAAYLGTQGPKEQHVRVVLGNGAPLVTSVGLQYLGADGDVLRETHFAYALGSAPRIVAHDPELRNEYYRLQIDLDTRDGRRSVQRQVRLGGGSTQIDVASVVTSAADAPPPPASDPK